jgi:molecular chaperone HtpG
VGQDYANRTPLLNLLRFASTHEAGNEPTVSLAQYVERMKPGQDRIYFVIADSIDAARSSPYIERLKERGLEVLLLAERIDEWVMGQLDEYEGKKLKDASRGDLDLGSLETEADKKQHDEELKEAEGLLKRVKDAVGDRIEEVRVSSRLTDSPACLALGEHDMGANMRRIMAATGQKVPESKPTLELNVGHPLVKYLEGVADEGQFKEFAQVLYEQAALAEGSQLANPAEFVQRLNRLLVRLSGVQPGAAA